MVRHAAILWFLCLAGCAPRVDSPPGEYLCSEVSPACPGSQQCLLALGRCVDPAAPCVESVEGTARPLPEGNACTAEGEVPGLCVEARCVRACSAGARAGITCATCGGGTCATSTCGDGVLEVAGGEQCDTAGESALCTEECTSRATLAAGNYHTCAIAPSGVVKCFGYNQVGELGYGDMNPREQPHLLPPVPLPETSITSVFSHWRHTCAMGSSLYCWGDNPDGNLGTGDTNNRGDDPGEVAALTPVPLENLPATLALGGGEDGNGAPTAQTCGLWPGGEVRCWGTNDSGELGLGDTEPRGGAPGELEALAPIELAGPAIALAMAESHACVVLADGRVQCWGEGDSGRLGYGDTRSRGDEPGEMGVNLPIVNLGAGVRAVSLAAGREHMCALLEDGGVKCWGVNLDGQLGLDDVENRGDVPAETGDGLPVVALPADAIALASGFGTTCAILVGGKLTCWGRGDYGHLGQENSEFIGNEPGDMATLDPIDLGPDFIVSEVSVGTSHACARNFDGGLKCWGRGDLGQIGWRDPNDNSIGNEAGEMGADLAYIPLE